jgi:putative ABC transport system permease protein
LRLHSAGTTGTIEIPGSAASSRAAGSKRGNNRERPAPVLTLALWQMRQTWRMLLVVGAGILAAVVLICIVPLYAQVAMSAGLRDTLAASPTDSFVTVHSVSYQVVPQPIQNFQSQLTANMQQNMGQFLKKSPVLSVQGQFSVNSPTSNEFITFIGTPVENALPHVRLLAGRLPAPQSYGMEIAITQDAASRLNLHVGSAFSVVVNFTIGNGEQANSYLPIYVSGIFNPPQSSDPFWHGQNFQTQPVGAYGISFPAIASNNTLLSVFNRFTTDPTLNGGYLLAPLDLYWYYDFDYARLDSDKLNDLLNGLNTTLNQLAGAPPVDPPFVYHTVATGPTDLLQLYSNRVDVLRVPLESLSLLIVALVIFFVSLMTDLLVEGQAPAIAMLRSRGASRRQVFASIFVQGLGLSIIALIIGPLLAILATYLFVQHVLAPSDQAAFGLITASIAQSFWNLRWPVLGTIAVALLAMILAILRPMRMDILSMRRESARSTRPPFWQRLRLDIVAAIIALTGFGFTLYIASPGVLDVRSRILILPTTALVGTLFLLLACLLLFLRLFSSLLRVVAALAVRARGAAPMLALAHIARAPRQAIRMTMLLAFALAMIIFTLTFSASQSQRIPDVAAYQVGSDFSGAISSTIFSGPLDQQVASYAGIPGVTSVTAGYVQTENISASNIYTTIELRAVNASTYAKTVIWPQQDSGQPIAPLMARLLAHRNSGISSNVVPAIVDAAAWQTLHLSTGVHFSLVDFHGTMNFLALAEVNNIPTINDTTQNVGSDDFTTAGGILVDFATYSTIARNINSADIEANTIWLRTRDDPRSLASVRSSINSSSLQLDGISDRRALIASLSSDPLYLALTGLLAIGSILALVLALLGNLTVSWLSARSRLTNFAVMRALGSTPRQIASVIALEQSITYSASLLAGLLAGLLFSIIIVPYFVFTTLAANPAQGQVTTGEFYVVQNVPPIQLVIPYLSIVIALAVLVVICAIALGIMLRIASRPSIAQALRLNED